MKYFAVVAVALFALQGCLAKPAAGAVEKNHVEELVHDTQNLAKKIAEQFGVKDLQLNEITETLTDNTKKLSTTLQGFVDQLDNERKAHQGDVNTALKTMQDKLTATVADLQKVAGPEATKKGKEMQVEFDKAYKTAVDQVEQLYKTHEPELKNAQDSFNKHTKSFLDSMLQIGGDLQKQVSTAIEEHEKTHSKN